MKQYEENVREGVVWLYNDTRNEDEPSGTSVAFIHGCQHVLHFGEKEYLTVDVKEKKSGYPTLMAHSVNKTYYHIAGITGQATAMQAGPTRWTISTSR